DRNTIRRHRTKGTPGSGAHSIEWRSWKNLLQEYQQIADAGRVYPAVKPGEFGGAGDSNRALKRHDRGVQGVVDDRVAKGSVAGWLVQGDGVALDRLHRDPDTNAR